MLNKQKKNNFYSFFTILLFFINKEENRFLVFFQNFKETGQIDPYYFYLSMLKNWLYI